MSGFIYFIQCGERVKIGWSRDPKRRLVKIQSDNGAPCILLGSVPGTLDQEAEAHDLLRPWRISGEWFDGSAAPVREACRFFGGLNAPDTPRARRPVLNTALSAKLWERGLRMTDLASALQIHKANLSRWARTGIPADRVPAVEAITGIPRHELRPDLYEVA
jgi:hypothetical protein